MCMYMHVHFKKFQAPTRQPQVHNRPQQQAKKVDTAIQPQQEPLRHTYIPTTSQAIKIFTKLIVLPTFADTAPTLSAHLTNWILLCSLQAQLQKESFLYLSVPCVTLLCDSFYSIKYQSKNKY